MNRPRFAPPRTQANKLTDALTFIASATPARVLEATPDAVCDRYGVNGRDDRRRVEAALVAAQGRLRREVGA